MSAGEALSFLTLAREDLDAARQLGSRRGRPAAFHLEQAAEKLIRAVLTLEGSTFPRTHQIGALAALLPEEHRWRADLMALDALSVYATALRYPMPGGGLPTAPDEGDLAAESARLGGLLEAVEEWCRASLAT